MTKVEKNDKKTVVTQFEQKELNSIATFQNSVMTQSRTPGRKLCRDIPSEHYSCKAPKICHDRRHFIAIITRQTQQNSITTFSKSVAKKFKKEIEFYSEITLHVATKLEDKHKYSIATSFSYVTIKMRFGPILFGDTQFQPRS